MHFQMEILKVLIGKFNLTEYCRLEVDACRSWTGRGQQMKGEKRA